MSELLIREARTWLDGEPGTRDVEDIVAELVDRLAAYENLRAAAQEGRWRKIEEALAVLDRLDEADG